MAITPVSAYFATNKLFRNGIWRIFAILRMLLTMPFQAGGVEGLREKLYESADPVDVLRTWFLNYPYAYISDDGLQAKFEYYDADGSLQYAWGYFTGASGVTTFWTQSYQVELSLPWQVESAKVPYWTQMDEGTADAIASMYPIIIP